MSKSPIESLQIAFDELEKSHLADFERSQALGKLANRARENGAGKLSRELQWENWAFFLHPVRPLFRPMATETRFGDLADGKSFPFFTPEVIDHFERRAKSAQNPLVVARLADIVWEVRRKYEFSKLAADAYLMCASIYRDEAAKGGMHEYLGLTDVVHRAAEIATSIGDATLAARVETVCFDLLRWLDSTSEYRWGLETVHALLEMKKHIKPASLEDACRFSERACEYLKSKNVDNFQIQQDYIGLLTSLAKTLKKPPDMDRWRREIAEAFAREAKWKEQNYPNGAMVASHFYHEAAKAYLNIGMKQESDEMLALSQERMKTASKDFKRIEAKIEVEKTAVDEWVDGFTTNKSPKEILIQLAASTDLVPDYQKAMEIAEQTAGISAIVPHMLYEGTRRVATAVTGEEIRKVQSARQFVISCEASCCLMLLPILDKAIGLGCSDNTFAEFFLEKGVNPDRVEMLRVGVGRFLAGDCVSSIHVVVPQIEAWLRDLSGSLGEQTTYVKDQVVHVHTLGTILSRTSLKAALGDRAWSYINAVLNDDLALDLRNKVAHGLAKMSELDRVTAALLTHICLLLTNVVASKPQKP